MNIHCNTIRKQLKIQSRRYLATQLQKCRACDLLCTLLYDRLSVSGGHCPREKAVREDTRTRDGLAAADRVGNHVSDTRQACYGGVEMVRESPPSLGLAVKHLPVIQVNGFVSLI